MNLKAAKMKMESIQEILTKRDDEVVVAFKGILKSASRYIPADPKKKNSQSIQVITLEQDGKTIKGLLKNRPPIDAALIGGLVYIIASKTDKGWTGIVTKDEPNCNTSNRGQRNERRPTRILRITATATITRGQDIVPAPLQPSAVQTPADAQKPLESHPGAVPGPLKDGSNDDPGAAADRLTEIEAVKEGQRVCWRAFNAMRMALRMAEKTKLAYKEDTGNDLWPDHYRVITSTYFIMLRDSGVPRWLPSRPVALDEMLAQASSAPAAAPPPPEPMRAPPAVPSIKQGDGINEDGDDVPW